MNYGFNSSISGINQLQNNPTFGSGIINPNQFEQPQSGYTGISQFGLNTNMQPSTTGFSNFEKTNLTPGLTNFQKAGIGLQAGSAMLNAYMSLKQYGLAKDQLKFQKDAFNKNYANQRSDYNRRLEDRQRARNAAGSGHESTEDYLNKHRIS